MALDDSYIKDRARPVYAVAIAAGVIAFLIYLPSLDSGFVNWDDAEYVAENLRLRRLDLSLIRWALTAFVNVNWHPLTIISYAVDYHLWGLDPKGYHLVNIVFHALNAALVAVLFMEFLRASGRKMDVIAGALSAAVFFGLHPAHVESVAWISERKDVLSEFFFLLAVITYLKYARSGSVARYLATIALFILALLSKPMVVTFPVVLLILDFYPLGRLKDLKQAVLEKAPFFALSAAAGVFTILAQKLGGAVMSIETYTISMRVYMAVRAPLFYIYKTLLPLNLSPYYPAPMRFSLASIGFIVPALLLSALTFSALWAIKRSRMYVALWAFYIVTLLPVIGLLQVGGQSAADRYTYLPGLALVMLVASAFGALAERAKGPLKAFVYVILLVAAVLLSVKTVLQERVWHDSLSLWNRAIDYAPMSAPIIYNNRGLALDGLGRTKEAIDDFSTALSIDPSYYYSQINRGIAYAKAGDMARSLEDFDRALRLKPGSEDAHYYRAVALFNAGRFMESAEGFTEALRLNPNNSNAFNRRGAARGAMGDMEGAIEDFKKAVEIGPENGSARFNLGLAYIKIGDKEGARIQLRTAATLGVKGAEEALKGLGGR